MKMGKVRGPRGLIRTVGTGAVHTEKPPAKMQFDDKTFQLHSYGWTSSQSEELSDASRKLADKSFDVKIYGYFEYPDFKGRYDKRRAIYKRKTDERLELEKNKRRSKKTKSDDKKYAEAMKPARGYSIKGALRRHEGKTRRYKPLNIRGIIYEHYSTCSNESKANSDKEELQKKGFTVLVRKYGPRKYQVYKGPKRKR